LKIAVDFPGGRRVDARLRGHTVPTDQPLESGGTNEAPSPSELFFVSLATCAGYYALRFCESRDLSMAGLGVELEVERPGGHGPIELVRMRVTLPEGFPERYRAPLLRAVDQCSVKKFVLTPSPIEVELIDSPALADRPN
jgi:putative redox protein